MDHMYLFFKQHNMSFWFRSALTTKDNRIPNIYLDLCKIQVCLCWGTCPKELSTGRSSLYFKLSEHVEMYVHVFCLLLFTNDFMYWHQFPKLDHKLLEGRKTKLQFLVEKLPTAYNKCSINIHYGSISASLWNNDGKTMTEGSPG